ncbi:MAG: endonuclease III [Eubacteriales bacterium]|nr:endonuclease III [Eubacteriales bacterium]
MTTKKQRVAALVARLEAYYPDVYCTLNFNSAHELLVGAILAAQCTDARVNLVTPALFAHYPTPQAFATADRTDLETLIRSVGLFRNKAKAIQAASQTLVERFAGIMPDNLNDLTALPGVGRKIANLILGDWFGQQAVVVDTHCARISKLLGLTERDDPPGVEKDLIKVLPPDKQTLYGHLMVTLGREICIARRPQCDRCPVKDLCDYGRSA